ncbi:multidrug ABC transporter permease/ATP-binding protein, partial [Streptococcus oralis]|nr:multidrug ABC transporter permease/ATP-binding protein [Streptococcus oralis]
YNALFDPMVLIFVGLSYLLTLIFGGLFISQGQLTVGELVTFITYLDMLVWLLQAMDYLFNISQRGTVSYERIESLLAQESDVIEVASPIT